MTEDRDVPVSLLPGEVLLGGTSKQELRALLESRGIRLNRYAEILLGSELFPETISPSTYQVEERCVADLGVSGEPTMATILEAARRVELSPGPLELAPYLRLAWDGPEEVSDEAGGGRAPSGSLTVVSPDWVSGDEDFPRGFYLRRYGGALWLRGYVCPEDHVWEEEDRILLVRGATA